jgi:hypothetical protein
MRIFKVPVGQYYLNAAFLANLRTCCMGNITSNYFELEPLSVAEYLALIN